MQPGWLDFGSIPKYCEKVSKRTIETWTREDGLRFVKIRGKRFVKKEWLDEFLEAHEVTDKGQEINNIVDEALRKI